jgi:eukaryotic-like serine/threonine-protein kinase
MEALGRYRVLKHLASGGMADVLLGRADGIEGFERHVVLKRIRAEHARDRRFISMFTDEARLAAGLHHSHIVQVFDIGEANGEYFFAMEYIHGEDVRKLLSAVAQSRGYVPLRVVCAIVSAAAAALHYAHERRDPKGRPLEVVHRDVSPSNVIIGYDGAVKLVDFGIAKAAVRQSETMAGNLKGKCSYMSPEQCKSEPIDRRSDVYGLGVLLYELATTARLFKGDNEYLVMDAIVNGRFALPQVRRPDLPSELSAIIMRALATERARRYQTADELRADLEQFIANQDLNTSPAIVASYMKKIFGVKPEPWLDLSTTPEAAGQPWSDSAAGHRPRDSRSNLPRESRNSLRLIGAPRGVPALETGPTLRLGWEATRHLHGGRNGKWLWAALPVVAIAAFAVWKLGIKHDDARVAAQLSVAAAPVSSPVVAEASTPRVVGSPTVQPIEDVAPAGAAVTVEVEPPPVAVKSEVKKTVKKAAPTKAEQVAVAPAAAPAPAPAPNPEPAAAVAVTPPTALLKSLPGAAPAKAEPAKPPAAVAAAPAPDKTEVEAQITTLSNATVSATAADHAAQLAACEKNATVHGDVSVAFQIDATGKVTRSQVSSTIKNPKVAGCVLRAVQSWKFGKPPSGAAKGVYSISYQ